MPDRQGCWSVHTAEGISLLNPQGVQIPLPYRKIGELLVILLRSPGRTAARSHLGDQLWPSSSIAVQATNVRQAIKHLRGAIGAENVVADRYDCSISETFSCTIDSLVACDPLPSWLGGWLLFLDELSYSSPVQFFEALRGNIDLLYDLPAAQLSVLVSRAACALPDAHGLAGWKDLVLGSVSLHDVPVASRHFLSAAKRGIAGNDCDLFTRSAFWLSACQILLGRVERAEGLASEALERVKQRGGSNESLLSSAKGTALLHRGRFAESREMMARASGFDATTVFEQDQRQALRAFYLATTGYEGEGMVLVEELRRSSRHHVAGRIGSLTELASTAIEAESAPRSVLDTFEPRIRTLKAVGQHHFALYAIEAQATALARCHFLNEARCKLQESRRIRRQLGITYSAWDARRLAAVQAS